jgi:transketolase
VAAYDQGAHVTYLGPTGSQMGKKESIKDTARVLGRMFHGIEYRGYGQEIVKALAKYSGVPVWNGLTDEDHPTQVLADFLTIKEHINKPLEEVSFVYIGDGRNNVANALMIGAAKMGIDFRIVSPEELFPKEELVKFRSIDSFLEGHPSMRYVPGVDMSTGSLGQGISTAFGMAMAGKLDNKDYNVFAILGDGEIEEGQVWEALMASAHYKLDNLIAFLDHNHLQIDGKISDVMSPEPVDEKFKAFGWKVIIVNGHDHLQIIEAIDEAKKSKGKPTMIVAETTKGKGVSFMENQAGWHGSAPNKEQRDTAIAELDAVLAGMEV